MARMLAALAFALVSTAAAVRANFEEAEAVRAKTEQALTLDASFEAGLGGVIQGESGTYELTQKLGSGAYGVVYLATEVTTGRKAVAKTIDLSASPEAKVSFDTERNVWKYMQKCPEGYPHPNIIEYYEVLQLSQREGVVVMELASGGSLASLLYKGVSAEGALRGERTAVGDALITDEAQAKKLFGQLASGAEWMAKCGIIHKDLKPDNIMFSKKWTEGGVLKIIDFGLATVLAWGESGPDANMYYNMAQTVDPRTNPQGALTFDDFALGMILAEFGTGVPPFFNPRYDYFSEKPGNLQDEKGLLYILADRKTCAKGDAGLWYPKRDLARGKVSIKDAVKEVAGRSLYYLKNKQHFSYKSALEMGISDAELLSRSWLYHSRPAMALLHGLMEWDASQRVNPTKLMTEEWLAGSYTAEPIVNKPEIPSNYGGHPAQEISVPINTGRDEKEEVVQKPQVVQEPKPQVPQVQTAGPACKNAYKERTAPSICNVKHYSSESCFVKLSCAGGPGKMVKLDPGFYGGHVDNCFNCKLLGR